jgi:hypothetical protein
MASSQPSIIEPSVMEINSPPAVSMSIGSIIDPEMTQAYSPLPTWSTSYSIEANTEPVAYSQEYNYDSIQTEPSPMYSSDGWTSPAPENMYLHANKQPYQQYDKPVVAYANEFESHATTMPMAAAGLWSNSEGYLYRNEAGLGIQFAEQEPPPVGTFTDEILVIIETDMR